MEALKAALLALTDAVYHFVAPPNCPAPYLLWQEEGGNDLAAGNRHGETCLRGTVDLYTKQAADPLYTNVPQALDEIGAAWYLNAVQYEEETGLYHYEWVVEVV